ncbi:MAG: hypothetical protein CVU66_00760 [Deltaproteobacteria bacterium HGW-Deltaproteobacteria-23]|nr:MAG: hypothetical protein CVU66_00760 [Deltaproteobacteria bacterium HGW-Deltaproteobacteria-23]
MKTGQKGIDLIKSYESLELKAYRCPAGVLTVGYGHTGSDVKHNTEITKEKAEELLKKDLASAEMVVNRIQGLNQNQYDALVSFVYNCGSGNFDKSTLKRLVISNPYDPKIREAFGMWIKANGKPMAGLVRRRESEANLYFS